MPTATTKSAKAEVVKLTGLSAEAVKRLKVQSIISRVTAETGLQATPSFITILLQLLPLLLPLLAGCGLASPQDVSDRAQSPRPFDHLRTRLMLRSACRQVDGDTSFVTSNLESFAWSFQAEAEASTVEEMTLALTP
jgi:hypothetical protein